MFIRIAACAALLVLSPICTARAGDVLSSTQPIAAVTQGQALPRDTQAEQNAALAPATHAATPLERPGAAQASSAIFIRPAPEPFGLDAKPVLTGAVLTKWNGVEAAIRSDNEVLTRCRNGGSCPQAARHFLAIVDEGRARNGRARIGVINRAINLAIAPTSDLAQWGVTDRWSAPLETFTTRRGDCEDYAIAKYVALKAAGVADKDVKLIVVRNIAAEEDHAVVAVRVDGAWIILDNRWLALVRDHEMWRAIPRFVLDDNGVRQFLPLQSTDRASFPQFSKDLVVGPKLGALLF